MKMKFIKFSVDIFDDGSLQFYKWYLFGFIRREIRKPEEQNKIMEMLLKVKT